MNTFLNIRELLLFVLILTFGSTQIDAQTEPMESELMSTIQQKYQEFGKYMQAGNVEGLVENLYTEDAKFYPPNGGMLMGTEGVSKAISGILSSGVIVMIEPKEVEMLGDAIYDYGVANVSNMEGEKLGIQRYMVIWKEEDGDWKIYRDFIKPLEEM